MKKLIPPVLLLICLAAMLLLRWAWPIAVPLNAPWTLLGLIPIAGGVSLCAAGLRRFAKWGTTSKPFREPTHLVTDGVYRYTRNPMYLGLAIILLGAWILLGALSAGIPVLVFILVTDRWYIRHEESTLARKFAKDFQDYRSQTRRWI